MAPLPKRRPSPQIVACCVALACGTAGAEEDLLADLKANASLALGVSASVSPSYLGSSSQKVRPHPLWAFQYGRIRLSTAGAAAVLGIAQDPRGPGLSAEFLTADTLRVGAALRIDRGRNSSSTEGLQGLPDIPATLRGRLYASTAMTPNWTFAGSLSQDLLGRKGGTFASLDLGYHDTPTQRFEWYAGASLGWADARYMTSRYGVPPDAVVASGYPAYMPGAGPTNLSVGLGFTAAMSSHWILFGSIGAGRMLGHAAESPITQDPLSRSLTLGIAYRWGTRYDAPLAIPRLAVPPTAPRAAPQPEPP